MREFRGQWRNEAILKGLACLLFTLLCAGLLAGMFSCGAGRWPWWLLLSPVWLALLGGLLVGVWMTRLALDVALNVDAHAEGFLGTYGPASAEQAPAFQPRHTPTGIIPIPGEFDPKQRAALWRGAGPPPTPPEAPPRPPRAPTR